VKQPDPRALFRAAIMRGGKRPRRSLSSIRAIRHAMADSLYQSKRRARK